MAKTVIISLGGSIIAPDEVDVSFLKGFRKIILDFVKDGNRAVIVCGGGRVCRRYYEYAAKIAKVKDTDYDWIGIMATRLNAELVRAIFSEQAYEKVIIDYSKKVNTDKKIIVCAGWLPGCSTDKDAVLFADSLNASAVINLSNVEYVYDKDPKKYKDAKPLENISWKDFRRVVGNKWKAGMNLPFDPVASEKAEKLGIKVIIMKGTELENFKGFLENKEFKGTVVE
ncbi:UMP kinase [Candidatus Woesearchaeota archaeon]|nr:UMP kinase [Candidatus Woesearchaeota archaeon]|tara:strand:- start:7586 stop:8266 length:681 start_codon:yes stop_codon:yes gene_type:complete